MENNERVRLTKAIIEAAQAPASGQRFIRDAGGVVGFALRVTADGGKSFIWEGRVHRRTRRITIAKHPDMTVAAARLKAQAIRAAIATGRDPAVERHDARGEPTFARLIETYLDDYAKLHRKTWRVDERRLRTHCQPLHSRRISDLSDTDVERLHREVAGRSGKVEANRVVELLRAMFGKAIKWRMMASNPALGVERFREHPRERFLSPDELRRVNDALLMEPDWRWRAYFPLALLLGPRKSELLSARWADIDLQQATWCIPTTKADRPHLLPLPQAAVAIIEGLPSRGGEWLFPSGASGSGHLINVGAAWARIRARAGVPDVVIHDLRRTLGSWLASAGHGLPIIGRALGHTSPRSTAIYARLALDPIRDALERNAAQMALGGEFK